MTALTIPEAQTPIVRDWWRDYAMPVLAEMTDIDEVREDARRLAALSKYVKDRNQRFELDAALRGAEIRIGELLGNGKESQGERTDLSPASEKSPVAKDDRRRFRLMAENKEAVVEIIEKHHVASRKRILARIERPKRHVHQSSDESLILRHGDFREVLSDHHGAIDAIITDPPYGREYLPLYGDLAIHAVRLLRPGGICAVMTGQSYLPEIFELMRCDGLDYRWTMAYYSSGAATSMYQRRLQTHWKPILLYEKPPHADHRINSDIIHTEGGDTDPTYHEWGQNPAGMIALVKRLTEGGHLVCDPFLGGGTTALACRELGLPFIGCDSDEAAVETTRERL